MKKLIKDYTLNYRNYGEITIPKGTPTTHKTACGIDENYNFVNSFEWIKPFEDGTPNHILKMDAESYGIDVPIEYLYKEIFLLSPDGFSLFPDKSYKTESEAWKDFEIWKERFNIQGYYSSNKGKILLSDLRKEVKISNVPYSF